MPSNRRLLLGSLARAMMIRMIDKAQVVQVLLLDNSVPAGWKYTYYTVCIYNALHVEAKNCYKCIFCMPLPTIVIILNIPVLNGAQRETNRSHIETLESEGYISRF